MSTDYKSMSVKALVEDVFPSALAAASAGSAGLQAAQSVRDAYVTVAKATVQADQNKITPLQAQTVSMTAWNTLGQVRQFMIDTGLMEIAVLSAIFRAIVDNLAYAIRVLSSSTAEAMRALFGGTPGDWSKWLLGGILVLGLGWLYVTGFTTAGQGFLTNIGRGQLAMGKGMGKGAFLVGGGVAKHAIPALSQAGVKLIPSLTGIL